MHWIERLYTHVPNVLDRQLMRVAAKIKPLLQRHVTIEKITGPSLSVLVADRTPSTDYFLYSLLGDQMQIERLASCRHSALPGVLEAQSQDVDLILARCRRSWADRAFDDRYWRLPDAVGATVDLMGDLPATLWNNRSNKNNLRRIQKNQLTWSISNSHTDLAQFYYQMYRPYMADRYGDLGIMSSSHRAHRYFQRGGLLWVMQDDRRLAATLYQIMGEQIRLRLVAPNPQHPDAVKIGAMGATYLYLFQWAIEQGYASVDLGYCRPSLADGVLLHKKYWGATLVNSPVVACDLLIRWPRWSPGLAQFLYKTPLIVRDGERLSGLTAIPSDPPPDPAQVSAHLGRVCMSGLHRIAVLAEPAHRLDVAQIKDHALCWANPGDRPRDVFNATNADESAA